MQRFMYGLTCLLGLTAIHAQNGEKGTPGVTPGEPGLGDHGQGMKGLGGGMVEVLCAPTQVAIGQPFTVNVHYLNDIKRPIDVHVDVLNAKTKAVFTGATVPMDFQEGWVTVTLKMDWAEEPFLWKVFTTPRGEPFPNMIAETGMAIGLGPDTQNDCTPIEIKGADPNPKRNVDYVLVKDYPAVLKPGTTVPVTVEYNLASEPEANLIVSAMYKGPNTLVNSVGGAAKVGVNTDVVMLDIPADVRWEPVYIVASLIPDGKTWEERLGEDRVYNTNLGRRLLRA